MAYDTIGSIAILKFKEDAKKKDKIKQAKKILEEHKNIKTILEKSNKVSGRLRTLKTKFLAGKNTSITIHKESGCLFKLDINKCYFSPRLSNDRIEIARRIKKASVLALFSGVAPYPIIISKHSKVNRIVAIELGKICCKYAKENLKLNRINNIEILQGDVRRIISKLKEKFEYIVMTRPQLKNTFLKEAFSASKKNTIIFYHGFGDINEIVKEIKSEAEKNKKKIKIIEFRKNGEIAPYRYRYTVVFKLI